MAKMCGIWQFQSAWRNVRHVIELDAKIRLWKRSLSEDLWSQLSIFWELTFNKKNPYCHCISLKEKSNNVTHTVTEEEQHCARIVLEWVTSQMTNMMSAAIKCFRILRPGKASDKTPKGITPTVFVKYRRTHQEKGRGMFIGIIFSIALQTHMNLLTVFKGQIMNSKLIARSIDLVCKVTRLNVVGRPLVSLQTLIKKPNIKKNYHLEWGLARFESQRITC